MDQMAFYQAKLDYEIDSWDVQQLLQGDAPPLLIDGRSAAAFAVETLPGAINLPHRTIDAAAVAGLPRDRLLVTFCDGVGCNASTRTALKLAGLGFRVREMIGGLDWWKRDGYPTTAGGGPAAGCGCGGAA